MVLDFDPGSPRNVLHQAFHDLALHMEAQYASCCARSFANDNSGMQYPPR
eukprot:CAMPEP_0181495244 /NCGR_PEP_ID=MMETSP1110-20121109/52263_1 /TAXON_ID=174948 /ORGANISM="Symbiodinium sp., Strain CCMP421" /LENGTH=49 /DNA_ID= /DNA_START= /DNA_END= /DNA_ORIENTATION=